MNKLHSFSGGIRQEGFTLIEILVVIGMIAILATVVIIAINPSRQFALGRNSQRVSNVNALLNAIGQNISDNKGVFTCAACALPTAGSVKMASSGGYDIASCLVPTYLTSMVFDLSAAGANFTSTSSYDTAYNVVQDSATGRITISAPSAELGQTISVSR